MMDGWDGGMGVAGWFAMTVLWVVLIGVIIWAVANLFPGRGAAEPTAGRSERPEEILDRRLALGEIDGSTYDELRNKLRAARAERV